MKKINQVFLMLLIMAASITANAGAMSDYLENKLIDALLRGQIFTMPTTTYYALATAAGSDTGCGTEVTGGSYARVAVTSSLANWAGTQSAGSTTASTGTSGTTSNNAAVTFPTPTANWGTVVEFCVFDAASAGNLLFRTALTTSKTINNGDAAPSFAIGAATFQIDN
ncbi:MAG TPA: hypothetical protein DCO68_04800 [Methylophilaceae bacterium]|nr:hypothetical protein [Methylophilaceae bacterium]